MNRRLFLAVMLIITPAFCPVVAQEHGPPAGGSDKNLREAASDVKGRSVEMDRVRRDTEKPNKEKPGKEKSDSGAAPNFAEIKEDFERIQIINGDSLQAGALKENPDYQSLSESAAEIEKRAIRLRSNLFGPVSGKKSKDTESVAEDLALKPLLTLLDDSITVFTHSPIFQNTKTVNPEDSTNAQKELDAIIKISARIRNEADRMKKLSSPPK